MRRRTPVAFAGLAVVVLGAVIGFASFTAEGTPAPAPRSPAVSVPELVSGRLTAAILSSLLSAPQPAPPTTSPKPAPPVRAPAVPGNQSPEPGPDAASAPREAPAVEPTSPPQPSTTIAAPAPSPPPPTITITQPPVTFGASVEQWRPLVATYFPPSLLDPALSVMACESGGDPTAENPRSSARGLYQFIASTWNWASANAGFAGASVHDPEANIATAAFLVEYSLDRGLPAWQHWVCQPDIPS